MSKKAVAVFLLIQIIFQTVFTTPVLAEIGGYEGENDQVAPIGERDETPPDSPPEDYQPPTRDQYYLEEPPLPPPAYNYSPPPPAYYPAYEQPTYTYDGGCVQGVDCPEDLAAQPVDQSSDYTYVPYADSGLEYNNPPYPYYDDGSAYNPFDLTIPYTDSLGIEDPNSAEPIYLDQAPEDWSEESSADQGSSDSSENGGGSNPLTNLWNSVTGLFSGQKNNPENSQPAPVVDPIDTKIAQAEQYSLLQNEFLQLLNDPTTSAEAQQQARENLQAALGLSSDTPDSDLVAALNVQTAPLGLKIEGSDPTSITETVQAPAAQLASGQAGSGAGVDPTLMTVGSYALNVATLADRTGALDTFGTYILPAAQLGIPAVQAQQQAQQLMSDGCQPPLDPQGCFLMAKQLASMDDNQYLKYKNGSLFDLGIETTNEIPGYPTNEQMDKIRQAGQILKAQAKQAPGAAEDTAANLDPTGIYSIGKEAMDLYNDTRISNEARSLVCPDPSQYADCRDKSRLLGAMSPEEFSKLKDQAGKIARGEGSLFDLASEPTFGPEYSSANAFISKYGADIIEHPEKYSDTTSINQPLDLLRNAGERSQGFNDRVQGLVVNAGVTMGMTLLFGPFAEQEGQALKNGAQQVDQALTQVKKEGGLLDKAKDFLGNVFNPGSGSPRVETADTPPKISEYISEPTLPDGFSLTDPTAGPEIPAAAKQAGDEAYKEALADAADQQKDPVVAAKLKEESGQADQRDDQIDQTTEEVTDPSATATDDQKGSKAEPLSIEQKRIVLEEMVEANGAAEAATVAEMARAQELADAAAAKPQEQPNKTQPEEPTTAQTKPDSAESDKSNPAPGDEAPAQTATEPETQPREAPQENQPIDIASRRKEETQPQEEEQQQAPCDLNKAAAAQSLRSLAQANSEAQVLGLEIAAAPCPGKPEDDQNPLQQAVNWVSGFFGGKKETRFGGENGPVQVDASKLSPAEKAATQPVFSEDGAKNAITAGEIGLSPKVEKVVTDPKSKQVSAVVTEQKSSSNNAISSGIGQTGPTIKDVPLSEKIGFLEKLGQFHDQTGQKIGVDPRSLKVETVTNPDGSTGNRLYTEKGGGTGDIKTESSSALNLVLGQSQNDLGVNQVNGFLKKQIESGRNLSEAVAAAKKDPVIAYLTNDKPLQTNAPQAAFNDHLNPDGAYATISSPKGSGFLNFDSVTDPGMRFPTDPKYQVKLENGENWTISPDAIEVDGRKIIFLRKGDGTVAAAYLSTSENDFKWYVGMGSNQSTDPDQLFKGLFIKPVGGNKSIADLPIVLDSSAGRLLASGDVKVIRSGDSRSPEVESYLSERGLIYNSQTEGNTAITNRLATGNAVEVPYSPAFISDVNFSQPTQIVNFGDGVVHVYFEGNKATVRAVFQLDKSKAPLLASSGGQSVPASERIPVPVSFTARPKGDPNAVFVGSPLLGRISETSVSVDANWQPVLDRIKKSTSPEVKRLFDLADDSRPLSAKLPEAKIAIQEIQTNTSQLANKTETQAATEKSTPCNGAGLTTNPSIALASKNNSTNVLGIQIAQRNPCPIGGQNPQPSALQFKWTDPRTWVSPNAKWYNPFSWLGRGSTSTTPQVAPAAPERNSPPQPQTPSDAGALKSIETLKSVSSEDLAPFDNSAKKLAGEAENFDYVVVSGSSAPLSRELLIKNGVPEDKIIEFDTSTNDLIYKDVSTNPEIHDILSSLTNEDRISLVREALEEKGVNLEASKKPSFLIVDDHAATGGKAANYLSRFEAVSGVGETKFATLVAEDGRIIKPELAGTGSYAGFTKEQLEQLAQRTIAPEPLPPDTVKRAIALTDQYAQYFDNSNNIQKIQVLFSPDVKDYIVTSQEDVLKRLNPERKSEQDLQNPCSISSQIQSKQTLASKKNDTNVLGAQAPCPLPQAQPIAKKFKWTDPRTWVSPDAKWYNPLSWFGRGAVNTTSKTTPATPKEAEAKKEARYGGDNGPIQVDPSEITPDEKSRQIEVFYRKATIDSAIVAGEIGLGPKVEKVFVSTDYRGTQYFTSYITEKVKVTTGNTAGNSQVTIDNVSASEKLDFLKRLGQFHDRTGQEIGTFENIKIETISNPDGTTSHRLYIEKPSETHTNTKGEAKNAVDRVFDPHDNIKSENPHDLESGVLYNILQKQLNDGKSLTEALVVAKADPIVAYISQPTSSAPVTAKIDYPSPYLNTPEGQIVVSQAQKELQRLIDNFPNHKGSDLKEFAVGVDSSKGSLVFEKGVGYDPTQAENAKQISLLVDPSQLKPGKTYIYALSNDGRMAITLEGSELGDQNRGRHLELAAYLAGADNKGIPSKPGVAMVGAGEIIRDPDTGKIYIDQQSGTFYEKHPDQWKFKPENSNSLETITQAIIGERPIGLEKIVDRDSLPDQVTASEARAQAFAAEVSRIASQPVAKTQPQDAQPITEQITQPPCSTIGQTSFSQTLASKNTDTQVLGAQIAAAPCAVIRATLAPARSGKVSSSDDTTNGLFQFNDNPARRVNINVTSPSVETRSYVISDRFLNYLNYTIVPVMSLKDKTVSFYYLSESKGNFERFIGTAVFDSTNPNWFVKASGSSAKLKTQAPDALDRKLKDLLAQNQIKPFASVDDNTSAGFLRKLGLRYDNMSPQDAAKIMDRVIGQDGLAEPRSFNESLIDGLNKTPSFVVYNPSQKRVELYFDGPKVTVKVKIDLDPSKNYVYNNGGRVEPVRYDFDIKPKDNPFAYYQNLPEIQRLGQLDEDIKPTPGWENIRRKIIEGTPVDSVLSQVNRITATADGRSFGREPSQQEIDNLVASLKKAYDPAYTPAQASSPKRPQPRANQGKVQISSSQANAPADPSYHTADDRVKVTGNNRVHVVLDGMTNQHLGPGNGGRAADTALRSMNDALENFPTEVHPIDGLNSLISILEKANSDVSTNEVGGSTATIVATVTYRGKDYALVAYVGDTPAYLVSKTGQVKLLTTEPSGIGSALANYLGGKTQRIKDSWLSGKEVKVATDYVELTPGDKVVIASDGVTGVVTQREIAAQLKAKNPAQALVSLAMNRGNVGSRDDASAIVIEAQKPPAKGLDLSGFNPANWNLKLPQFELPQIKLPKLDLPTFTKEQTARLVGLTGLGVIGTIGTTILLDLATPQNQAHSPAAVPSKPELDEDFLATQDVCVYTDTVKESLCSGGVKCVKFQKVPQKASCPTISSANEVCADDPSCGVKAAPPAQSSQAKTPPAQSTESQTPASVEIPSIDIKNTPPEVTPGCWGTHSAILKVYADDYQELVQDYGEVPGQCTVPKLKLCDDGNKPPAENYLQCGGTFGLESADPTKLFQITKTFDCNAGSYNFSTLSTGASCNVPPVKPKSIVASTGIGQGLTCQSSLECQNNYVCDNKYHRCVASVTRVEVANKNQIQSCSALKETDHSCYDKEGQFKNRHITILPDTKSSSSCSYLIYDYGPGNCQKAATP